MSITAESLFGPLPESEDARCEDADCDRPAAYWVVTNDGRRATYCAVHLVLRAHRAVNR